ncbi:MAG: tetratricopeptide repeat protein [Chitinophagales bacterium]
MSFHNKDYYNIKSLDSGIYYLNQAIELDKNYYNTYENMIKLLRDKNDYKGMISTLKIMQSLNPQNSFLVIREAQVFELLGDTITSKKLYSDGIEKFKEVINDDSGFDLRQEYFMSLFLSGNDKLAVEEIKSMYKKYPYKTKTLVSFLENSNFWISILK